MNITEYFDIGNCPHLKAYQHLQKTGRWSEEFWKEIKDIHFDMNWQIVLMSKMANAYIDTMLNAMDFGKEK